MRNDRVWLETALPPRVERRPIAADELDGEKMRLLTEGAFLAVAKNSSTFGYRSFFVGGYSVVTYTSKAIVDAVNMCLANYRKIVEEVEL